MNVGKLAKEIHENAQEKGFWDEERNRGEVYALIVTELGEAVESDRKDEWAEINHFTDVIRDFKVTPVTHMTKDEHWTTSFKNYIKDSVEDELADTFIRCLDWLYFRHREYIILKDSTTEWEDNFAANIFKIQQKVCQYRTADAASDIISFANHLDIDLEWHIENKMKFNAQRERLHGKQY